MTIFEYTFTRRRIAESPAVVRSQSDTLPILRALIGDRETERLAVLWLDTKHHVIGSEVVYVGNVSASLVRVGELFRGAVRVNATAIIVAHNHPSGDPTGHVKSVVIAESTISLAAPAGSWPGASTRPPADLRKAVRRCRETDDLTDVSTGVRMSP